MRIVVNDHLGHAPQVQLSRALAARGHEVLHLYSSDVQSPKADLHRRSNDPPGFAVEGLTVGTPIAGPFVRQRLQEAKLGRIVAKRTTAFRPDIVIGCNNPLDVQRNLLAASRRARAPFIYWLQQFEAIRIDEALEGRSAMLNMAAGSYYHWLEQQLLQRSDAVIPIADDFAAILAQVWDVFDRQCMVVRNWAPLDAVAPGNRVNAWSREQQIADKRVVLYIGTLGRMEDPMCLVELAQRLREHPDIVVLVVAEGEGAERVSSEAKSQTLPNLRVLPFQPYEQYGDVLASADVLIGLVSAKAGILFVPSKVTSYFCAARPVVLSAPWQNLAAQTVRESGGGCVVPPEQPAALSEAVLRYINDDSLRQRAGQQGRAYAERVFDIADIAGRFERLCARLHSGVPRQRKHQLKMAVR